MRLFDLHCDTLYRAVTENTTLNNNSFNVTIDKGTRYAQWCQCFAIWIPDDIRGENAINLFDRAYLKITDELLNKNIAFCKTRKELKDNIEGKKHCALLTVEGGAVLNNDINNLYKLKKCGVRMMTLTWNGYNEIGGGIETADNNGLTDFGKEVITLMDKLDIVVDISHASENLFYDVANNYQKPIVASHSNAKGICGHKRNLTDEQFKIIKESKGLVGINLCDYFLRDNGNADINDIIKNTEYFLSLGGENILGFGCDFDGADIPKEIYGIESMNNIYEAFLKHNYKESLLDKIFFKNCYEFFTDI